jgi:hypothetical protein
LKFSKYILIVLLKYEVFSNDVFHLLKIFVLFITQNFLQPSLNFKINCLVSMLFKYKDPALDTRVTTTSHWFININSVYCKQVTAVTCYSYKVDIQYRPDILAINRSLPNQRCKWKYSSSSKSKLIKYNRCIYIWNLLPTEWNVMPFTIGLFTCSSAIFSCC